MSLDAPAVGRAVVCASGIIYWAGVSVQAARIRRRVGRTPNVRPRGAREKLLWLGWLLVIAVWIGQPLIMTRFAQAWLFSPHRLLPEGVGFALGLVLVVLGHAGTYWSYAALGDSWRMGISSREKTTLITCGPYSRVRHPIYAFQLLILLGAAFLLPTALSVLVLCFHAVLCRLKASSEEAYLAGIHAEAYREYSLRTGRFLPRLGR